MITRILITGGSGFIGTYLVEELLKRKFSILNVDITPPIEYSHIKFWKQLDILSKKELVTTVVDFAPEYLVHLAARTDTEPENTLEDYKANTEGTANILSAIKSCPSIKKVIITSTQFVHQYNGTPKNDEDFAPHTVYGQSKVISEKLTREANPSCCWTIVRPTNVWGPRHPRYAKEFWYVLKKGKYLHPGGKAVIRSYGYVGNVVDQILKILNEDPAKVHQQVFYVGDEPINLYDWVNGFSLALTRKNIRIVPRFVVKSAAVVGDILGTANIKFPITLSRYKSMTQSNSVPMEKTFQLLGAPKYSLQQGIEETVEWLKKQDKFWEN
jgi:GlcNAc-P-P-Und epimerase